MNASMDKFTSLNSSTKYFNLKSYLYQPGTQPFFSTFETPMNVLYKYLDTRTVQV